MNILLQHGRKTIFKVLLILFEKYFESFVKKIYKIEK